MSSKQQLDVFYNNKWWRRRVNTYGVEAVYGPRCSNFIEIEIITLKDPITICLVRGLDHRSMM